MMSDDDKNSPLSQGPIIFLLVLIGGILWASGGDKTRSRKVPGMILLAVFGMIIWFTSYSNREKPKAAPQEQAVSKVVDEVTGIEVDGETVIMLSIDGCSWCKKWENEERYKFEAASIHTDTRSDISRPGYPVFRIWNGFDWKEHVGFMTFEEYKNGELQSLGDVGRVTLVSAVKQASETVDHPKPVQAAPQPPKELPAAQPEKQQAVGKPKTAVQPAQAPPVNTATVSIDPISGFHVSKPTVIVLSKEGCGPCLTWERNVAPTVRAKGVEVFSTKLVQQPSYPTFRIYDGKGNWHTRSGSKTTRDEILRLIGK